MKEDEDEKWSKEPLLASQQQQQQHDFTLDDVIEAAGVGTFQIIFLVLLGSGWIAEAMELMILSILSPILTCEWDLSTYQEAMIATVAFIGMAVGSLVCGYLSDLIGRKKVVVSCFSLVFICGLLTSLAPSYTWLIPLQLLVGVGVGGGPQIAVIGRYPIIAVIYSLFTAISFF